MPEIAKVCVTVGGGLMPEIAKVCVTVGAGAPDTPLPALMAMGRDTTGVGYEPRPRGSRPPRRSDVAPADDWSWRYNVSGQAQGIGDGNAWHRRAGLAPRKPGTAWTSRGLPKPDDSPRRPDDWTLR